MPETISKISSGQREIITRCEWEKKTRIAQFHSHQELYESNFDDSILAHFAKARILQPLSSLRTFDLKGEL